jgi:hypothetical protein
VGWSYCGLAFRGAAKSGKCCCNVEYQSAKINP